MRFFIHPTTHEVRRRGDIKRSEINAWILIGDETQLARNYGKLVAANAQLAQHIKNGHVVIPTKTAPMPEHLVNYLAGQMLKGTEMEQRDRNFSRDQRNKHFGPNE